MDSHAPLELTQKWPDENGTLVLRIWVQEVDGQQEVVGVELWGRTPVPRPFDDADLKTLSTPSAIRSTDARIPLGELRDKAVGAIRGIAEGSRTPGDPDHRQRAAQDKRVDEFLANFQGPQRGKRSNLETLQTVARVYESALAVGSRKPNKAVAEAFPGYSESGIRSLVRRASKAGFLAEGQPGKVRKMKVES
jgi:hypothetical protein